jgi:acylphosphatase
MTAGAPVQARLRIHGRVQGVFFRGTMCEEAQRLGVRGWVRNCADGTVEAVIQGSRAAVDRLVVWAHGGPPGALVTHVEVSWEAVSEGWSDFGVRRR